MRVTLDYDRSGLDVEIPDANLRAVLRMKPRPGLPDPARATASALAAPLDTPPLRDLARGKRHVCIAISDVTRPVPYRDLLPPLLDELAAGGVDTESVLFLVATGLHRPATKGEIVEILGERIAQNCRVESHVARDPHSHRHLGETGRGTPILVDARYLDADLRIVTGEVAPHLLAGYSGGRKAVCPGLCGVETIRHWHGLRNQLAEGARPGCLQHNSAHDEAAEIAARAGSAFAVTVVKNERRRPVGVFAGDLNAAFRAAVACFEEFAVATLAEPADIVVTSAGGHPLDTTYYQTVKGVYAARAVVRKGGTIIVAAGMRQGLGGGEFSKLLAEYPDLEEFLRKASEPDFFIIDQWQPIQMALAARHAEILACTDGLSVAEAARLPVRLIPSVEEGIRLGLDRLGADATIAVIPSGPYVLARLSDA